MKLSSDCERPTNIDIQIERWPINKLIPRATNPRTHTREQVAKIFLRGTAPGRLFQISTSRTEGQPGGKIGQSGLVAELFSFRYRFRVLNRRVKGDVVRFVFNRKDFHFRSPSGASTAAITFITRVGNTSKRIVRGFGGVPGSADSILDHAAKAIELEGIEVRVSELERTAEAKKSGAMI